MKKIHIPNWMKGSLAPDLHLEGYLKRWWIIPRNHYFNIYLHCFVGDDDDRALHDHPWHSLSFLLKGRLMEEHEDTRKYTLGRNLVRQHRVIRWMWPYYRPAYHMHRMTLGTKKAWTVFMTGPRFRDWGFRVGSEQWQDHQSFLDMYGPRST